MQSENKKRKNESIESNVNKKLEVILDENKILKENEIKITNLNSIEEKKKKLLAWKQIKPSLGINEEKKVVSKATNVKEEDTLDSFMNELNKTLDTINENDLVKYNLNKINMGQIDLKPDLEETDVEFNYTKWDEKGDTKIPTLEPKKKKLFEVVEQSQIK